MKIFVRHITSNVLLYILAAFFSWTFFYHLDYTRLSSWDEAWYASIAREMVRLGTFVPSIWNSQVFFDHPPMGFWLMALSYKIFGINEFATRFPSAILGVAAIILMYKTGEALFKNKFIGFVAAIILGTSVWYVIRARSGNLDSIFVFFYIATIYCSVKASQNFKWFPLVGFMFGGLVMSKTLVGLSALPLILLLTFHQIVNVKKNWFFFFLGLAAFYVVTVPWYAYHLTHYSEFYQQHVINIGMRNKTFDSYFKIMPEQPLFFIHMGVRKWYYLWLLGTVYMLGRLVVNAIRILFTFIKNKQHTLKERLLLTYPVFLEWLHKDVLLIAWNIVILYPFLTSERTELWHLIPVYIPLAIIIAFAFYDMMQFGLWIIKKTPLKNIPHFSTITHRYLIHGIYLAAFLYIAFVQFRIFRAEVFPVDRYTPPDVDISQRVGKYTDRIYLDDDYLPMAVFYSGKRVRQLAYQHDSINSLPELFKSNKINFVVVVRHWAVKNLENEGLEYKVLEKNNDFWIITKK